jgi:long-subunit acyl-CoA synthetase (AMP-forming)
MYVLDSRLEAAPVGVKGELYISGAGLARGYVKRAEMTGERFMPARYGGRCGQRMYRTGDAGRYLPDGNIEFLGRVDNQVKIRGYRIELGEIEAVLNEHRCVKQSVVVAREDEAGEKRLVAYYTMAASSEPLADEEIPGAEELRAHLRTKLPEYMAPAAYVKLEKMPLTASGKLDRKGLPAPDEGAYAARDYEAPQGEIESVLAKIWAEALGLERVGRWDNFFELGGHSLLALKLIERMRSEGLQADVHTFFITPTIAKLAAGMEKIREIIL